MYGTQIECKFVCGEVLFRVSQGIRGMLITMRKAFLTVIQARSTVGPGRVTVGPGRVTVGPGGKIELPPIPERADTVRRF